MAGKILETATFHLPFDHALGVYLHIITTFIILTTQNICVKGILNVYQYSSIRKKIHHCVQLPVPGRMSTVVKTVCKYISGEGKCELSGVCHCLPSPLLYKTRQ